MKTIKELKKEHPWVKSIARGVSGQIWAFEGIPTLNKKGVFHNGGDAMLLTVCFLDNSEIDTVYGLKALECKILEDGVVSKSKPSTTLERIKALEEEVTEIRALLKITEGQL